MSYNLGRLKWRSRRSILELDIYFDSFIRNGGLDGLSIDELIVYNQLLNMDDGDILSMLHGMLYIDNIKLRELVDKIKLSK